MLNHYSGKGVIYLLLSILYMAPELSEKNNSKYILCAAGILCIIGDFKYDKQDEDHKYELKKITTDEGSISTGDVKNNELTTESDLTKKPSNPYDYPEDF